MQIVIPYKPENQEKNQAKPCLLEGFQESIVTSAGIQSMQLPKRELILGNWFLEGDLGFVYGPRGLGKTWLSMYMAKCISEGKSCHNWQCSQARRVLYIDGEMPADGIKDRDASLSEHESENLHYLSHEIYFNKTGKILALADSLQQDAILNLCIEQKIKVLFLDNLSCLFSGMAENQADDWERVLPWLLSFRRNKISVVIVHHSGKRGDTMRGTSRREDAAFWVIGLSNPVGDSKADGARFISRFTKDRNSSTKEETLPCEWTFEPSANGKTSITCRKADDMDIFEQCLREGLNNCGDIAEEMGCKSSKVSKMAAKAEKAGWLTKDGRNYKYVGQ